MEKSKYQMIREKAREQYRNHDETALFYDEQCAPQLIEILKTILTDDEQTNALLADGRNMNLDEPAEHIQAIRDRLKNGNFNEVAQYIINLDGKVEHENSWKSLSVDEQSLYFVTLLRTYLFDDFVSESASIK